MMKLVILSFLLVASAANAETKLIKKCTLSDLVDSKIFDDSLSKDVYPLLAIAKKDQKLFIQIGAYLFTSNENFMVTVRKTPTTTSYEINSLKTDYYSYLLTVFQNSANISVVEYGKKKHLFAKFTCE